MKKGKILILGGSVWQFAIVQKAKEMGFFTIVADISPEAPSREIADDFVCVDTNDSVKLAEYAREKGVNIVIAEQTDRVVPIAAFLNEKLNLKGIDPKTALKFTDKYLMREALKEQKISMPDYQVVSTIEMAGTVAERMGYPLIIKPRASQSSFGVYKIMSPEDLRKHFDQSLQYSKDGSLLLEQFIGGTEVTVEGLSLDGVAYALAISEKEHFSFNDCVAKKIIYPPSFDDIILKNISNYIKSIVECLGLVNGIFHAELKVISGKPYLIEVAARGGGHKIASVIVPHISGVNMYECLLRKLNNENVQMKIGAKRSAILGFFDFKPGKVKAIRGLDVLKKHPNIHEVVLRFKEGDEIKRASDDTNRIGYYILLADTREEIMKLDDLVSSTLQIEYL